MTLDDAYRYAAERVDYDPETGALTWKQREGDDPETKRWNARYAGRGAGTINNRGYLTIQVQPTGKRNYTLLAHRVAWLIAHGALPSQGLDHINGSRVDNRLSNLRAVTQQENGRNARLNRRNTSGTAGVSWYPRRQLWRAYVKVDGCARHLGYFVNKEDAIAAAQRARLNLGFTPRHCGLGDHA